MASIFDLSSTEGVGIWNKVFIHGNAYWSKTEEQNKSELFTKVKGFNKFLPNEFRKNNIHLFPSQILLQTLKSIISHHKKSASVWYNAKSQAIYIFGSYSPMCQIFRVHILCRKLFSFFSSFIQNNKKQLRQDASNRNPKALDQPLQVYQIH